MQIRLLPRKIGVILQQLNHLDTDMDHIKYPILLVSLWAAFLFSACHAGHSGPETSGRDSVYTAEYIQKIAFDEPEKALALLDTAEAKKLLTPFDISDLRCLVYHNGLSHYKTAYTHALKAYNDPEARKNPEKFLSLVGIMAEECHNNGNYTGSVDYCAEGLVIAQKTGDKTAEANLHITWGLNLLEMEQYDEAFRHIDLAIGILDDEVRREPCFRTWDELFYALGMKLNLLWEKDRYNEALALRPRMEEALRGLDASNDTPEGITDMRRAEMDVSYCCIAYTVGNRTEGDSLRRRVEANPYASTPDGEYLRIPCLLLAKRYDEALYYIRREKALLKETTDTVNWDYINPHLQTELEAHQGKGDWRSASRVQSIMLALTDTLRKRERKEDALELAEIYKTNEKDKRIERLADALQRHYILFGLLVPVLILLVLYIRHILKTNRIVSQKNDAMVKTIDELMAYEDELLNMQKENIRLDAELQRLRNAPETETYTAPQEVPENMPQEDETEEAAETANPAPKLTDKDRALYERMNYEILSRQLYLRSDINKKELLKEFHIPANKFALLFKEFAGCSFSQYIQERRLGHAIRLMREQPNWNLEAIAKESKISKSVFYDLFKKKYGMKPSQYREKGCLPPPLIKSLIISILKLMK